MLKHSYLLTSPTGEAECQIRGLHYFVVLEEIHGKNLFPTAMLLLEDLSPTSAGGTFSQGRGWEGGKAVPWGTFLMTAPGPCCRRPHQSSAMGRGPWQPAHQGAVWHISLLGVSPTSGERMVTVPLRVCCAFTPSTSFIFSPGLSTPEYFLGKYLWLVLSIVLLV